MATFIILGRLTLEAKRDPAAANKGRDQLWGEYQKKGFKFTSYSTLGPYDFVTIVDAPSEELMLQFLMAAGLSGNIESTTLRAFSAAEVERIRKA